MSRHHIKAFFLGLILMPSFLVSYSVVSAQTEVQKLQSQIEDKNSRLEAIEKEIAEFESALKEVGAEKSTLQGAINQLNLEHKKVSTDINYTRNKIANTDLEISKLSLEVIGIVEGIIKNEAAISEVMRSLNTIDNDSLIEVFLRTENLADFWNEIEGLETVKSSMGERVRDLSTLKTELEGKKETETSKRDQLDSLRKQYLGQEEILQSNKNEKGQLLSATKNEEAEYQAMLKAKKAAKEQLAREVQDIESQLKFILDPNTIPTPGTTVFQWPLKSIYLTQYFGYTKFALSNPGVYKNSMHNGIDLSAPLGTSLYAPLAGTVRMTGNTDAVPGCYSWGKWMLIDHPNGLSTLFAHLSNIGVTPGQKVSTGDVLGFTGSTGYSTGPHLHYTLYVSDAVEVKQFNQFKAVTGCGSALSPFSAVEGYLNPLDFLPTP